MQGLLNKQQSFPTLPFITSLFSKGPFATKDIATVCCRKFVTSSKWTLHHGKGVTFKLQERRSYGHLQSIHSPRNVKMSANSKSYKTTSWLKKSKSGKSSGSSCTVTKRRKGKIIFKVARQSLPKLSEEPTSNLSSSFGNSINKVFVSKIERTRQSNPGLNDSMMVDSISPVDKLTLPQFKDTSIINVGHGKLMKASSFTVKNSHSTEVETVVKQNQSFVKNFAKMENGFSSNLQSTNDSHCKLSHVGGSKSVSGIPTTIDNKISKVNKDLPIPTTQKRPPKARSKPLVFSSSEMLYSNIRCSDNVAVGKMKKLENSDEGHEVNKLNKSQVKDGALSDVPQKGNLPIQPLKENSGVDSDILQNGNLSIQPLEERGDSTVKLFLSKGSNGVERKGSKLADAVMNIMKYGNDVGALEMECAGEKCVLKASKMDKLMGDHVTGPTHKNSVIEKVHETTNNKPGHSPSLIGDIAAGDKPFPLPNNPLKEPTQTKTSPKIQTFNRNDNVTLHKHLNLKRPIKNEKIKFDTIVIEKDGKKITKIKPKHNSNITKISQNRSVAKRKSKVYLGDSENPYSKLYKSSKVKSSINAKNPDSKVEDKLIPQESEQMSSTEIDPFIPKMDSQSLNSIKVDKIVVAEDARVIKEGERNKWRPKESKSEQNTNVNEHRFSTDGLVTPQDGNTVPKEVKTNSYNQGSSLLSLKMNQVGKSTSYSVESGMVKRDGTNTTVDNSSFSENNLGINKHVFVKSNPRSQEVILPKNQTTMRSAIQPPKESESAKGPPQTLSQGINKPDIAPFSTNKIGDHRISQSLMKNKDVDSIIKEPVGLNEVPKDTTETQNIKKIESNRKENTKWRSLYSVYNNKTSNKLEKIDDAKESLHPSFADSFTVVSENTATTSNNDRSLSRNVTKIKYNPQSDMVPIKTLHSSESEPLSNQRLQQSTTEPKMDASSDSAAAIVLKSRIAQSPPEAVRFTISQTQSSLNGLSQMLSGVTATNNVVTGKSELGNLPEAVKCVNPPARSSLASLSLQTAGQSSISSGADNFTVCKVINNCGKSNACDIPSKVINNCGKRNTCDIPKPPFPPTCQPKANFPPKCHNPQALGEVVRASCSTDGCSTKSVFPPPCSIDCKPSIVKPNLGGGNQESCLMDSCNTKSVFPPPCPNQCESPQVTIEEQQASCPTCKPAFPPPCPSTNPCSSIAERAENTCYDPCNPVTKSKTHSIIDIDNMPRPHSPICKNCTPKSKPCFPPECPKQSGAPPNSCCQRMDEISNNRISSAGWRAYVSFTFWSVKCTLTGIFEEFLNLLKTRIMHVCAATLRRDSRKTNPLPQDCKVIQSAVALPKKPVCGAISGFNRNPKHVNLVLQQKAKPNPTKKIKKKVVVRSVKKTVLNDRSKRAILEEEQKRKCTGAKATPALAYSEVLNIVFNQKKSA